MIDYCEGDFTQVQTRRFGDKNLKGVGFILGYYYSHKYSLNSFLVL